ncbi:uncharacterized protein A1O9_04000 [Exophiala aquamarina CBS 119918]|uniref:VOC domain-containing protein n=1 Tax=Exophiala aquamarina CBS 119918 TaxID=1182545 RepID=A0A072PH14_9EURO|nr:uncharacterized protein A1O9_04000 [Exophiala aquamarina CBS 119918]KEF59156.1 hypothetical protein A1O9_04000 [Exophiala aquamarina CBS 119918]
MVPSILSEHTNGYANGDNTSKSKKATHPSPSAFAHVVLRTTKENYRTMVDFYKDMLQAEVVIETEEFCMLRYDFEHHRIAIAHMPQITPQSASPFTAGLDHTAFTYKTLTDLARTYRALKQRKTPILPLWCVNHGMTTSMYYRDPDGNKVELQVDNFDTPEEADSFMSSPLFIQNPVGTDFDPDEWSSRVLDAMNVDGSEGLSAEERRQIKTRVEIGSRPSVPAYVHGI